MQETAIQFHSDGMELKGSLYLPEELEDGARAPGIVACSGYLGLNSIYPKLFARFLTERGFVVLGFDYRGTGESAGEQGRLLVEEEARDIRHAVSYLRLQAPVDPERVALVAWGMGAACAVLAAAPDPRVGALVLLNGFFHGLEFLEARHRPESLEQLRAELEVDRAERVQDGKGRFVPPFHVYPLDPATEDEVKRNLQPVKHFGPDTALELLDSLLSLDARSLAPQLGERPVFVGHGKDNALHPIEQSRALYEALPGPRAFKEIPGRHNDFMQEENPVLKELMDEVSSFLHEHLAAEGSR